MEHVVCQIVPVNLSLFELGILVDTIHNDAPDYKLFKNQCYWFMLMIFKLVLRLYNNALDSQSGKAPDDYLPKLSRKWAGLLIVTPVKEILDKIEKIFRERQDEEFSKVMCYLKGAQCRKRSVKP